MTASPNSMVEDIFIIKVKYIMKRRLSNHTAAKDIIKNGIYLFKLDIAPWQIEIERFTSIQQCMNCYGNDHDKGNCDKEKITKCSECNSKPHTNRN